MQRSAKNDTTAKRNVIALAEVADTTTMTRMTPRTANTDTLAVIATTTETKTMEAIESASGIASIETEIAVIEIASENERGIVNATASLEAAAAEARRSMRRTIAMRVRARRL